MHLFHSFPYLLLEPALTTRLSQMEYKKKGKPTFSMRTKYGYFTPVTILGKLVMSGVLVQCVAGGLVLRMLIGETFL